MHGLTATDVWGTWSEALRGGYAGAAIHRADPGSCDSLRRRKEGVSAKAGTTAARRATFRVREDAAPGLVLATLRTLTERREATVRRSEAVSRAARCVAAAARGIAVVDGAEAPSALKAFRKAKRAAERAAAAARRAAEARRTCRTFVRNLRTFLRTDAGDVRRNIVRMIARTLRGKYEAGRTGRRAGMRPDDPRYYVETERRRSADDDATFVPSADRLTAVERAVEKSEQRDERDAETLGALSLKARDALLLMPAAWARRAVADLGRYGRQGAPRERTRIVGAVVAAARRASTLMPEAADSAEAQYDGRTKAFVYLAPRLAHS